MKHVLDINAREIAVDSRVSTDYAEKVRKEHADRLGMIDGLLNLIHNTHKEVSSQTTGALYNSPFVVSSLDKQKDAIAAMRSAGAILIGETKYGSDPLGLDTTHDSPKDGNSRTPNPWDFNRVAGGVNGASAAAVASGCAAFSVAADHCGDLIISANFCGTVALRPTRTTSSHGWHCRSVSDAIEIFQAASGRPKVHGLFRPTIWIPTDYTPYNISNETLETIKFCTEGLLESQINVRGIHPPMYKQAFSMWAAHWTPPKGYQPTSPTGNLAMMMHQRLHEAEPEFGKAILESAVELKEALISLLSPGDVIMCPAFPDQIPKPKSCNTPPMSFIFSALFSALDLPALHVPVGFNTKGHPIGVQLIAAPDCENALFEVGAILEDKFRGWTRAQPFQIKGL